MDLLVNTQFYILLKTFEMNFKCYLKVLKVCGGRKQRKVFQWGLGNWARPLWAEPCQCCGFLFVLCSEYKLKRTAVGKLPGATINT